MKKLLVAILVCLVVGGANIQAETLLSENWESYDVGEYPSDWLLGGKYYYEHYPNNHVVARDPGGSTRCMMVSNPYTGWGMDLKKQFSPDLSTYKMLLFELDFMYPGTNSHAQHNDVDVKLRTGTVNDMEGTAFYLNTDVAPGSDGLGIWASTAGESQFLSAIGDFDEWVHIKGELDLQTATYNVWANGSLVGSDLLVSPGVSTLDLRWFACGKGFANPGPGYYDNILVRGVVPEPGTALLLGLAGLAMLRRHRR